VVQQGTGEYLGTKRREEQERAESYIMRESRYILLTKYLSDQFKQDVMGRKRSTNDEKTNVCRPRWEKMERADSQWDYLRYGDVSKSAYIDRQ
jgi:hypothetical protein